MKFDLHVHTNFSDGLFRPEEVVDLAIKQGLQGIAITDHDTILGIEAAVNYGKLHNFIVIPGIEFGCTYKNEEVHLLGYFINYKDEELIELSSKLVNSRMERGIKIVEKLNGLGINITLGDVKKHSGDDYIGRPHIARALIDKGYIENIQEAFNKYLNIDKQAYVERFRLSVEDTIDVIKRVGGIPVLAHPGLLKNEHIVDYAISKGIQGIECIHSKHSKETTARFKKIAIKNDLIITGGSDFHGDLVNGNLILGEFSVNLEEIKDIRERINYGTR